MQEMILFGVERKKDAFGASIVALPAGPVWSPSKKQLYKLQMHPDENVDGFGGVLQMLLYMHQIQLLWRAAPCAEFAPT